MNAKRSDRAKILETFFDTNEHRRPKRNDEGGQIWSVMDFHQKAVTGYWVTLLHESERKTDVRDYLKNTLGDSANNWGRNETARELAQRVGRGETLQLGEKYYLAAWFVWYGFPPLLIQATAKGEEIVTRAQARQRIPAPHRTPVLIEPEFDDYGNPVFTIQSSHNYA